MAWGQRPTEVWQTAPATTTVCRPPHHRTTFRRERFPSARRSPFEEGSMPDSLLASGIFAGVPTFFRACCHSVKCRLVKVSYEYPGRELTRHLIRLQPYGLDDDAWGDRLDVLSVLVSERRD